MSTTRMSRQQFDRIKVEDFERFEAENARLTQERDALAVALAAHHDALGRLCEGVEALAEPGFAENWNPLLNARAILAADQPVAGAELLAAIDVLQRRWDAVCDCVNEFEPEDMGACGEAKGLLDDAILHVLRARPGRSVGEGPGREGE